MILQPPSSYQGPLYIDNYEWSGSILWITAVAALIFGIFMLVAYINKRRIEHLLWSIAFCGIWIVFHQVIANGYYTLLIEPEMSGLLDPIFIVLSSITPGLIAAGLIYAVFDDKKIGNLYLGFVSFMAIVIFIAKIDPSFELNWEPMDLIESIAVMVLHVPSGLAILLLPILKNPDRRGILMSIGGVLLGVVGIILAVLSFLPEATYPELWAEGNFVHIIFGSRKLGQAMRITRRKIEAIFSLYNGFAQAKSQIGDPLFGFDIANRIKIIGTGDTGKDRVE